MSFGKLPFDQLKSHLWAAADILRGSLDANEYRQPIMTLLFLKRLNDQFEERAEELEKNGKSKKDAWEDPDRHTFFVPKEARWNVIASTFENIGEKIDKVCSIIERANPVLEGVLTNTVYNGLVAVVVLQIVLYIFQTWIIYIHILQRSFRLPAERS